MFFTSTRLPLAKARWVPRINGHPLMPYNDIRPSTPQDSADGSSGSSFTPAWDPSSRTPRASTSASDGDSDPDFDALKERLSLWSSSFYPQPSLLPPQPKPGIVFSFQIVCALRLAFRGVATRLTTTAQETGCPHKGDHNHSMPQRALRERMRLSYSR